MRRLFKLCKSLTPQTIAIICLYLLAALLLAGRFHVKPPCIKNPMFYLAGTQFDCR